MRRALPAHVAATRDESGRLTDKIFAARLDLSGIREKGVTDAGLVRKAGSRRAVLTLRGCYNKRVRLYSR